MCKYRRLLAFLGVLAAGAAAHGHGPLAPYGYGFARGGISFGRGPARLSIGFGAFSAGAYGLGPIGPPWGPAWGHRRSLTIIELLPPPPPPRPIIVVQPPPPPPVVVETPPPDPGEPPPVPPMADDRRVPPVMPEPPPRPPEKEPKKEAPRAPKRAEDDLDLPRPPAPADDPLDESGRQLALGREAFRAGEYGRAAQRFRQAARLAPDEARPNFLLAQALLAQGKYHEARDAVLAGLRRDPAWPKGRFRPLDLYGDNVADYAEHLRTLERVLTRHPGDPVLLFLSGYQLWFDGRRDEAATRFRRALPRSADRDAIDRFLRALPDTTL